MTGKRIGTGVFPEVVVKPTSRVPVANVAAPAPELPSVDDVVEALQRTRKAQAELDAKSDTLNGALLLFEDTLRALKLNVSAAVTVEAPQGRFELRFAKWNDRWSLTTTMIDKSGAHGDVHPLKDAPRWARIVAVPAFVDLIMRIEVQTYAMIERTDAAIKQVDRFTQMLALTLEQDEKEPAP